MQLILLSGGSGKRLWPLSNVARSKQFLPLLQAPDGSLESMVQRVVRQIKEAGLECDITITTNVSQRDYITNQLGRAVDMVTEPQRKGTFPAIALSVAYLSLEKKLPDDETVVVMPCDPYTGMGYFNAIGKMADCVRENAADLVLMGIKPTYPSAKYGYVLADHSTKYYHMVTRFTEKPDAHTAQELIDAGAYWNGGVFAFRLGYMMGIVRRYVEEDTYADILAHFDDLPSRYFDYEVVEKAQSLAMVPFDGFWKDLGTWNTLSEELPVWATGNVIMGAENQNTHVINELPVPVFCDGLKDVIVAAGPDGILVSAKRTSENVKNYVDQLRQRPMYEERRWGIYVVTSMDTFSDGFKSLSKTLTMYPGKSISYQLHRHRDEVWTFVDGEGLLVLDDKVQPVHRGMTVEIPKTHKHGVYALTQLQFVEVQSGDLLEETDIERFPWDWDKYLEEHK